MSSQKGETPTEFLKLNVRVLNTPSNFYANSILPCLLINKI